MDGEIQEIYVAMIIEESEEKKFNTSGEKKIIKLYQKSSNSDRNSGKADIEHANETISLNNYEEFSIKEIRVFNLCFTLADR
ncbi:10116_t:CDS:2 [Racocetra fulgida]|uniref:10116_t:CDS:1 n=1 Tax=Racocetra fulgida TaxID=60492 RepID=A0A9N8YWD2_9GLOM|nr:10116_t:CDS:2 [Racocetra fulgida]